MSDIESDRCPTCGTVVFDLTDLARRAFRTNISRDLYAACGRAFGLERDEAKRRLLAALCSPDSPTATSGPSLAEVELLRAQLAIVHQHVDQTDPFCPIGIALTKAGSLNKPPTKCRCTYEVGDSDCDVHPTRPEDL